MSVLFNIADKITASDTTGDYLRFRKRVLADGGTITDDAQLRLDMEFVEKYKPSWFASPAVRKTDVLYGAPNLDGTVTRTTTKTGINKNGDIGTRVAGELPWSYKDDRISFLPESARTNLIRNNTMQGAVVGTPGTIPTGWSTNNSGLITNVIAKGTINGVDYIDVRITGTATLDVVTTLTFMGSTDSAATQSQPYTSSAYLQLLDSTALYNSVGIRTSFRNSSGIGVAGGTIDSSISLPTSSTNRLSVTVTAPNDATIAHVVTQLRFFLTVNNFYDFTIRIGLPQTELGSFASSVIKTTDTAVTRNADVLTVTGASDVIGQTEGTLYCEFNPVLAGDASSRAIVHVTDGTTDNRVQLEFQRFAGVPRDRYVIDVRQGGSELYRILESSGGGVTDESRRKIAIAYKNNDYIVYQNGSVLDGTITGSGTLTSLNLNRINIGIRQNQTSPMDGWVQSTALFPTRLSNAELETLTTL